MAVQCMNSELKIEVVMSTRLTCCDSRKGAAGVTCVSLCPENTRPLTRTTLERSQDMNGVRETGLVLSNSVLHMRIVNVPSRLHALSVILWLAHYGYLITQRSTSLCVDDDIPSENFWSNHLTSAGRTQITGSNIGSLLYVSLHLAI